MKSNDYINGFYAGTFKILDKIFDEMDLLDNMEDFIHKSQVILMLKRLEAFTKEIRDKVEE